MPPFRLAHLPSDVRLHICDFITSPDDVANFCLATPRLGLAARRHCAAFKDPAVSVAFALRKHTVGQLIDEQLLRRYAAGRWPHVAKSW